MIHSNAKKQNAMTTAPLAAIVLYETRYWVVGKKGTIKSTPTTTEAFARRSAAHYQGRGYAADVVSVDTNGRKTVLA